MMSDEHTRTLALVQGVEAEKKLLRAENTRTKELLEDKNNEIKSLNTRLMQEKHTLDENSMIPQ
eukprot:1102969-Amphidinium_carterae.2